MITKRYQKASQDEIAALERLVKKVDTGVKAAVVEEKIADSFTPEKGAGVEPKVEDQNQKELRDARSLLFRGAIAHIPITRSPLRIDNPIQLLLILMPELKPYKWQFEELMRVAGYLETGKYEPSNKTEITKDNPYKAIICAANGSGKDAILIAASSVWFVLTGIRNRVIATSSSFEQLKVQTEVHIRELIKRANVKFGTLFKSIQFHHVCPALGGEIKLFATDEAGMAEGYHAFFGGKLMKIINEAKTVSDEIFEATERWTGVSHVLVISSPGWRRGKMFLFAGSAIHYPSATVLGKYYFRRVTAFECPHISITSIQEKIDSFGENSPLVRSSIFAEFSDYDDNVVIPEYVYNACDNVTVPEYESDIGIGLDLAAGGDEDACFVRKGNKIIHSFFFRQPDTDIAAELIDSQLSPWKWEPYILNADNGGVGKDIIDKLVTRGWHINRCNNQSPPYNKREFLNLGAESWMHLRRLIERKVIILPKISKLKEQLTGRYFRGFEQTQGKVALESKKEARINGRVSPDRADAFVLCFWSYSVGLTRQQAPVKSDIAAIPIDQFMRMCARGIPRYNDSRPAGRFTLMTPQDNPYGKI